MKNSSVFHFHSTVDVFRSASCELKYPEKNIEVRILTGVLITTWGCRELAFSRSGAKLSPAISAFFISHSFPISVSHPASCGYQVTFSWECTNKALDSTNLKAVLCCSWGLWWRLPLFALIHLPDSSTNFFFLGWGAWYLTFFVVFLGHSHSYLASK